MYPDIVIFLDVDWAARAEKNRQHFLIAELARQLEGRSKVLGVERPICPWTNPFRKRAKFVQWLRGERSLRRAGPNLYIYTPFVFAHNLIAARIPGTTALNRGLLKLLLGRVLKQIEFRADNLIAWVHHPYQAEDVGLVGEKRLIYDCYDDYIVSEPNPVRRRDLKVREWAILRQADWVFVVSEELLKLKRKTNKNVHLIPNGVEFEHFAQAAREEDGGSIPWNDRPTLGFTGKITLRLDFRLLAQLATAHPNWNLVMVGPQEHDAELVYNPDYRDFMALPNVHMTGSKEYRELPASMRSFDVCILPYTTDDPFNMHCSPLKLYEYLATGKPIVSTDLPAVRPFDSLVRIAQDAEEFERQVAAALEERDEELRQRRLAVARENSWEKRAVEVLKIIGSTLEEKLP